MSDAQWHSLEGIEPDSAEFPIAADIDGEHIVIYRVGAGFRAVQRLCPHKAGDFLENGTLLGNGSMLRCGLHGFVFKLDTGKSANAPGFEVTVYDVTREGDNLKVRKSTAES